MNITRALLTKPYLDVNSEKSKDYKQACDMELSSFIGDEYGNPMHVDWVVRSQWQNMDGGPWNWNPFLRKCDKRICNQIKRKNWVWIFLFI